MCINGCIDIVNGVSGHILFSKYKSTMVLDTCILTKFS